MPKLVKATIEFKNPDFTSDLQDRGMTEAAAKKVSSKAQFNEYYSFELQFDAESGQVLGVRQVKVK